MATFTHIIFVVGSLLLLHSGYSAVQRMYLIIIIYTFLMILFLDKSFLKLAEMYYNGLPLDVSTYNKCVFMGLLGLLVPRHIFCTCALTFLM